MSTVKGAVTSFVTLIDKKYLADNADLKLMKGIYQVEAHMSKHNFT